MMGNNQEKLSERGYWFWISRLEEIGIKTIEKLLRDFQSMEAVFHSCEDELRKLNYLTEEMRERLLRDDRSTEKLHEDLDKLEQRGIHFVSYQDKEFPSKLLEIYEAPYYLYYRGELPCSLTPSIAIIGARNCSTYGCEVARSFAKELAKHGIQIMSGLARGVDGQAHLGALVAKGKTFGVVGNGLDICYPKENYALFEQLKTSGGIISEYPLTSRALAFHFPMRNRLIAGLSDGIFVVEAREKSGTLITVDRGLEQGNDIYALPGKITDNLSIGCNRLIQNGAKLVLEPFDIIEELRSQYGNYFDRWKKGQERNQEKNQEMNQEELELAIRTENERKILDSLSLNPKHVEMIAIDTKLSISEVLEELTMLEIGGKVSQVMAQCYIKRM